MDLVVNTTAWVHRRSFYPSLEGGYHCTILDLDRFVLFRLVCTLRYFDGILCAVFVVVCLFYFLIFSFQLCRETGAAQPGMYNAVGLILLTRWSDRDG